MLDQLPGVEVKQRKRQFHLDNDRHRKHVKILRELPHVADERIKNIARRNELLRANQLYNARLERQRAMQAFTAAGSAQQRDIIRQYMGGIETSITSLAQRGLLPMDLAPSRG